MAPYKVYVQLLEEVQKLIQSPVQVDPIPPFVTHGIFTDFSSLIKQNTAKFDYSKEKQPSLDQLPTIVLNNLFEFQKEGVQYGIKHHCRVLIGDEMGVGKTIQALSLAYLYLAEWPLLVVAPSSLKLYWKDEILKWFTSIQEFEVHIVDNKKKGSFPPDKKIYIMSYDLAKNIPIELSNQSFKIAIADEVHYLKSKTSKRSQLLIPILKNCNRIILLSGTPILSRPMEIFNASNILRPDIFKSEREFGYRYCDPKYSAFTKALEYKGYSNVEELHFLLSSLFMIRRFKSDVLSQLPPKMRQKIPIKVDPKIAKKIDHILSDLNKSDINNMLSTTGQLVDHSIVQAYSLTGEAKIDGIIDFIESLIESDKKFIVFAHHIKVLDAIEHHIAKRKSIKYIRIDGSTDQEDRHAMINNFEKFEEYKIAVLSITACSQGITLISSNTVVFAELNWTPAIMEQAEDRVHRVGQKNSVSIYYLCAESTLDSYIMKKLDRKFQLLSKTLNGLATVTKFDPEIAESIEKSEPLVDWSSKNTDRTIINKFASETTKNKIGDYFKLASISHSTTVKPITLTTVQIEKMAISCNKFKGEDNKDEHIKSIVVDEESKEKIDTSKMSDEEFIKYMCEDEDNAQRKCMSEVQAKHRRPVRTSFIQQLKRKHEPLELYKKIKMS